MKNKHSLSKTISFGSVLIFPLFTLFLSLRNYKKPEARNVFWLFCIFLGMIHIISPIDGSNADGTRYAQRLIDLHYQAITWENFTASLFVEGGSVDLYNPLVTYILSIFTDNPRWLFLIYATVFGFFYSRNMWFVLERLPEKNHFIVWILTIFYFLICPIWQINGVRMWTAMHVFVYGALPYLLEKDRSKLGWCILSLFFHFSFFIPLAILLIFMFIPKRITPLLIFFLITLFINTIDMEFVRTLLSNYLPDFLQPRVTSYTNDTYVQVVMERKATSNLNIFVRASEMFSKWIITSLLIYISIWGKSIIKRHKTLYQLLCFSLFIYGISNILSLIPSGSRFITISQMLAVSTLIFYFSYYYTQKNILTSSIIKVLILSLSISILFYIRVGCDYYGISLFLNPIGVLFVDDSTPLIQFIKSML